MKLLQALVFLLLVLDVLSDRHFVASNRAHKITMRPEALTHEIALSFAVDPRQVDRALAFDAPHHVRHRIFRWNRQKHVNMVRKQMPLFDLRFFLGRELSKNLAQRLPQFLIQHQQGQESTAREVPVFKVKTVKQIADTCSSGK